MVGRSGTPPRASLRAVGGRSRKWGPASVCSSQALYWGPNFTLCTDQKPREDMESPGVLAVLFRKGLGWLKASWPLWLVNKFFEQVPPVFGPRFSPFWNRWPGQEGGLWCGPQRPQCPALHPRPLLQLDQYGLTGPCFCFYFKKFTQLPHLCPSTAFGDSIPNPYE